MLGGGLILGADLLLCAHIFYQPLHGVLFDMDQPGVGAIEVGD